MTTLKTLKRLSKWRAKVRVDLDGTVKSGVKIYGVRRDGKYVEKSLSGEHVLAKRSVKGAVVAKRAIAS